MSGLLMICPTRGRPANAVQVLETFRNTRQRLSTQLVFVVDEDDPLLAEYETGLPAKNLEINEDVGSMGRALNSSATMHAAIGIYDYLGFIGDDHQFRTSDWDEAFVFTLEAQGGGFVYGNDLLQGANLPTHIVMNTSIVSALGWMSLPGAKHLFLDDTWKTLGNGTQRLFYLPEVIVEHIHPFARKAEMDEGYTRVNAPEMYDHDGKVFQKWLSEQANSDITMLRQVLSV